MLRLRLRWHLDAHLMTDYSICTFWCCLFSLGINSITLFKKRNELLIPFKVGTTLKKWCKGRKNHTDKPHNIQEYFPGILYVGTSFPHYFPASRYWRVILILTLFMGLEHSKEKESFAEHFKQLIPDGVSASFSEWFALPVI